MEGHSEEPLGVDPRSGSPALDSESLLRCYDKILRIRINHCDAGFFAYVTFVLNQLRYCEEHGLFPAVYFGPISENGPNPFYDPRYGDNTWDYYFEPVAGLSFAEIRRRVRDPGDALSSENVVQLDSDLLWELHAFDPDSIYNYPYGHYKDVEDIDTWYALQRRKARRILSRYVRPKQHVMAKVEEFWRSQLSGFDVLGVHMRGSDKGSADGSPGLMRIVEPTEYFPHIDRFMHEARDGRIFLATDQSQFIAEARARYGDRLVSRDVIRADAFGSGTNPFQQDKDSAYLKGEEVLIDCLLLARSDFLLRCTSAVGEYAMYFNENLECLDLNRVEPARPASLRAPTPPPEQAVEDGTVPLRRPGVLFERFDAEVLLHNTDEDQTTYLNATATLIWDLVDGRRSVSEIVREIEAEFPGAPDLSHEIREAIAQLVRNGVLVVPAAGISQPDRPALYHDLQCLSGFGDRLLDVWAAATVARLLDPTGVLAVRWDEGLHYEGFVGTYATELFSVESCELIDRPPPGAIAMQKEFSHTALNDQGVVGLASGARQIALRSGMIWGNSCPDQLHSDLGFYELDTRITLEQVIEIYRRLARSTEPDPRVVEGIPDDIERRVGVHVRLQDKLVEDEAPFDMDETTWRSIERSGNDCIDRCIEGGEPLFVCSDDSSYRAALLQRIRSSGGDVVVAHPPPAHRHLPGYESLVDFFALSRCARIVQMTKYSNFSLAAALAGDVPLVNFYRADSDDEHRLDIWRSTLRRLDSA